MALGGGGVIEVTDEADTEGDIIEVVAVDMAALDLATPAVADFDFAVARGGSVADDEVVGEAIGHSANMEVIVIEGFGVALASAAVVNDDVAPAPTEDGGLADFFLNGFGEIFPVFKPPNFGGGLKAGGRFEAGFFDS